MTYAGNMELKKDTALIKWHETRCIKHETHKSKTINSPWQEKLWTSHDLHAL